LFACGSLGVIVYLNLKAGRSFGWPFVPEDARHEARDRDYFFVLGFWAWGVWAGMGAIAIARRFSLPTSVGMVVAALPVALNWSAVNRRTEPEAGMARMVAVQLLEPLPARTVLFVGGDNDTYPLWYYQQVEGRRRDVTVVTLPLLGAPWYVTQLREREHLPSEGGQPPASTELLPRRIAESAMAQHRPVAVATTVPASDRNRIYNYWTVIGVSLVARDSKSAAENPIDSSSLVIADTSSLRRTAASINSWRQGREAHGATDPVHEYFLKVLSCPGQRLEMVTRNPPLSSLDSLCNPR
jgi:hypothetical protein